MAGKIDKLSVTLGKILRARGIGGRLHEYRIIEKWGQMVGTVIARHAQPHLIRGKRLTLIVDSPAWMQQLSLLKQEIIEKVNKNLGKDTIQSIILKLGEITSQPVSQEKSSKSGSLSREDAAQIEACLQGIRDPDVRQALQKVMEKDFLNRKNIL